MLKQEVKTVIFLLNKVKSILCQLWNFAKIIHIEKTSDEQMNRCAHENLIYKGLEARPKVAFIMKIQTDLYD